MAVSTIDGTIQEAVLKRSALNIRIYRHITFQLADGTSKSIVKPIADAKVAALLQPGASGRFYIFTAPDHRGIHGVRDDQGHEVFAFPKNNEKAMMIVTLFGIGISALLLTMNLFSGWAIICLAIGIPFYFIYRNIRMNAERQFAADGGYRPIATAAAAQPASV
jgi:hypothetical protein